MSSVSHDPEAAERAAERLERVALFLSSTCKQSLSSDAQEAAALIRAQAAEIERLLAENRRLSDALFIARGGSFDDAFAEARKLGLKEFLWRGGRYHTRTREEDAAALASEPRA